MRKDIREALKKAYESGITPYNIADNFMPIYLSSREVFGVGLEFSAGLRTLDYDDACQEAERHPDYRRLKAGMEDLGFGVDFLYEPTVLTGCIYARAYVFRDRKKGELIKRASDYFRQSQKDLREGKFSQAMLYGINLNTEILEFPDCCGERYVREKGETMRILEDEGELANLGNHFNMAKAISMLEGHRRDVFEKAAGLSERRARVQLSKLAGTNAHDLRRHPERVMALPLGVKKSYFVMSMFPCKPGCENAVEVGMRILETYERECPELAEMYRELVLPTNTMHVWLPDADAVAMAGGYVFDKIREWTGVNNAVYVEVPLDSLMSRGNGLTGLGKRKIGRNAPCPCGSGMKYTRCCGRH